MAGPGSLDWYSDYGGGQVTSSGNSAAPAEGLGTSGMVVAIAGMAMKAVGGYYEAYSQKSQLKSQALSADLQATLDDMNANAIEQDAQRVLDAGQQQLGFRGMVNAQQKASQRTSMSARGVQLGVGSAAETQASTQLAYEMDALTIRKNTAASAGAARMQEVNVRNQANLRRVSASNMRATARSINPWLNAGSSMLGSASSSAAMWSS